MVELKLIIGLSHALESIDSLSVQSLSVVSRLSRLYIQLYPEILLAMGKILIWYPEILLAMGNTTQRGTRRSVS